MINLKNAKIMENQIFEDVLKNSRKFHIDKYISDDPVVCSELLDSLTDNSKTLAVAPMGAGKTYFVMNKVQPMFEGIGYVTIIVLPNRALLNSFRNKHSIPVIHGESYDTYIGQNVVATTPESLLKIVEHLEQSGQPFGIIEDEAHQKGIDYYRTGYRQGYIQNALNSPYCRLSLHLTATPTTLVGEKFNNVVHISSNSMIKSEVEIVRINKNINDTLLEIASNFINEGKRTIVFNDNIADNKHLEEMMLHKNNKLDIQQVNSKDAHPENISRSKVTADLTITTSSIIAGIDLDTPKDSVLIVNANGLNIDNLIQLIGRFRKGINVVLVSFEPKHTTEHMDFLKMYNASYRMSSEIVKIANNDIDVSVLYRNQLIPEPNNLVAIKGSVVDMHCLSLEHHRWVVDEVKLKSKVAEQYSRSVLNSNSELVKYLYNQSAFDVIGDIKVIGYESRATTMKETKKLIKELNELRTSAILGELEDSRPRDLELALCGDYDHVRDDEVAELVKEYKEINPNATDRIYRIMKYFFKGVENGLVRAFHKMHEEEASDINKQMKQIDVREINRVMNNHGGNVLLNLDNLGVKDAVDIRQCKIRYFLYDLELKQGRISDKKLTELTQYLLDENNLGEGLRVKRVKNETGNYEKDFEILKNKVKVDLDMIYNLTDNRISSVKI